MNLFLVLLHFCFSQALLVDLILSSQFAHKHPPRWKNKSNFWWRMWKARLRCTQYSACRIYRPKSLRLTPTVNQWHLHLLRLGQQDSPSETAINWLVWWYGPLINPNQLMWNVYNRALILTQGIPNSHLRYPRSELWEKMIWVNYQFKTWVIGEGSAFRLDVHIDLYAETLKLIPGTPSP